MPDLLDVIPAEPVAIEIPGPRIQKADRVNFPKEEELAAAYAQKFWDAGNAVITIMFAVSFGIYYAEVTVNGLRTLTRTYFWELSAITIIGNLPLLFLLFRLYVHETRTAHVVTDNPTIIDAIRSAFEMRFVLLCANIVMFLAIMLFIKINTPSLVP